MKKLFLLCLGFAFSACQINEVPNTSQKIEEATTPMIKHVSIPLNQEQKEAFSNYFGEEKTRPVYSVFSNFIVDLYSAHGLTLLTFSAEWSGPCRIYALIYESASSDYVVDDVFFLKADIESVGGTELAQSFGVRVIPVTYFLKNGSVVAYASGVLSRQALDTLINQYK